MNWLRAQLMLAIWNPALMDFITNDGRRNGRRLFYKAKGIVLHDRALSGDRMLVPSTEKETV